MFYKFINLIYRNLKNFKSSIIYHYSKKYNKNYDIDISLSLVQKQFKDPQEQYALFHHYFWHNIPVWVRNHRAYYKDQQRGFGEDAFHAMWYLLINELRPSNLLEIGVYRGQVISLWSLIAKHLSITLDIHGISPFSNDGDEVSAYIDIDYYSDVINNFNHFSLPLPNLHHGYSTDPEMVAVIQSVKWDVIYIDGSHDYNIVKSDFEICSSSLSDQGVIILDDSALNTTYDPPLYASAGHPGPSIVANEINNNKFREILSIGHNRVFRLI